VVFERLFPDSMLERKEWVAFCLAIIYSTLSIVIARLLFPANSGIVSIVFLSIFLIPTFNTVLKREERQERKEKDWRFRHLLLDNADAIKVYLYLFFGIYLMYMAYAFIAPSLGFDPGMVFREQLGVEGTRGGATFSTGVFWNILLNNWWVLLACFLIALIAGDGAVFFVAWNASTWGTIFGYRAIESGALGSPLAALGVIILVTLPHVLLEGGAYILAALAGGVLSDEIIENGRNVSAFVVYFVCALLGFALYAIVLRLLVENALWSGVLTIAGALLLLYTMRYIFTDKRERRVFTYNYYLFALAIGIFIVGAIVETFVLGNVRVLLLAYG
jgi:uncharacterized membrane protein SpoIIM required for sporulation